MADFSNESLTISEILSRIGYSRYMRTVRQKTFKRCATSMNNIDPMLQCICSGSKAEGLSALCENDIDMMCVPVDIVCSECLMRYRAGERRHIFYLSKRCTAPGYTMLQVGNICDSRPDTGWIKHCLVEHLPGKLYISSDVWKNTLKQGSIDGFHIPGNAGFGNVCNENHGPSNALSLLQVEFDAVFAMTCYCPSFLNSWLTRERQHNWPTTDVIEEVSELESHVVPVGSINSPLRSMEWRICYTKAEIRLIRSLPDFLIKVYVLVKAIVKVTLKPICKEISSYIMKNIVLWIAELNPIERLSDRDLVTILQLAFRFLKSCLVENNLPSYMIPKRNLFANRLTLQQRSRLCMRIDCLLREGPRVVYRVKKMRDALNMFYRSPEEFRLYFKHRQIIEVIVLMVNVYMAEKCNENSNLESCLRKGLIIANRISPFLSRLIPEQAYTSGDGKGETRRRGDLDSAVRIIRENGKDVRNNPILKYLS